MKIIRANNWHSTISIVFSIILALLLLSCSDSGTSENTGPPQILSVSNTPTFWNDIITISGMHLGTKSSVNFIIFKAGSKYKADSLSVKADSVIKLSSLDCTEWNNSSIKLTVPKYSASGKLYILLGGVKSNEISIVIERHSLIDLIEIPSGTFLMGSAISLKNEMPVHQVTISNAFYIGKYELTQNVWSAVIDSNPSLFKSSFIPVHSITWIESIQFCNELSKADGLDTCYRIISNDNVIYNIASSGYRLPTEAEWEYACRAGSTSDFSGSGNIDLMGWYDNNSGFSLHNVGLLSPNQFGLYDTHGNVWEYCWDFYDENYYLASPSQNPLGPDNGTQRVIRGGSAFDGKQFARSANRTYPRLDSTYCGVRIVRTKI